MLWNRERLVRNARRSVDHFTVANYRVVNFVAKFLQEIIDYSPVANRFYSELNIPRKLLLVNPQFCSSDYIEIPLGVSLFFKLMVSCQIKLGSKRPILQKSLLGWIVVGECTLQNKISLIVHPGEETENNKKRTGPSDVKKHRCIEHR